MQDQDRKALWVVTSFDVLGQTIMRTIPFIVAVALVGQAAAAQDLQDKWRLTTEKDPMTDKVTKTASLEAEGPIEGWVDKTLPRLVVRCSTPVTASSLPATKAEQPGLDVYVVTGMAASVENAQSIHTVTLRFDSAPAEDWDATESTNDKALFLSSAYAAQVMYGEPKLASTSQLLVRFTPFNSNPVLIKFDTRGFDKHAAEVLAACPAVDRSHWVWPPSAGAKKSYNDGIVAFNEKRWADAETAFRKAIAASAAMADAHYFLGMILLNENKLSDAATSLREYLKLAPDGENAETAKAILASIRLTR